jgi:transposase
MFKRTRRKAKERAYVGKALGVIQPRVAAVGPERFGIVAVDCGKGASVWMLADFYGRRLLPPQEVLHTPGSLAGAISQLRELRVRHDLADLIVAIERTGRYHLPVQQAFRGAGFETRIVHPLASRQYRELSDPSNKTDHTDLDGIHRAAANGFGLIELPLEGPYLALRTLARHRRDLVEKRAAVLCQIREYLELTLPGFATCFDDLWDHPYALHLARQCNTPAEFLQRSLEQWKDVLRKKGQRFQEKTLLRVLQWARTSLTVAAEAPLYCQLWHDLDDDRLEKNRQIQRLEQQLAEHLALTPYLLLLSLPGINVVSAAELAGELGPIAHYASARAITGRAGLFPRRYQSHHVDHRSGLCPAGLRPLRFILLCIADNLALCNPYYRGHALRCKDRELDPRLIRVKIAGRFSRVLFQMVAGGKVFQHPACQQRDDILQKLLAFHHVHGTPLDQALRNLETARTQIPALEYAAEAAPLAAELAKSRKLRRGGVKTLPDLLPVLLARLGVGGLQSESSE